MSFPPHEENQNVAIRIYRCTNRVCIVPVGVRTRGTFYTWQKNYGVLMPPEMELLKQLKQDCAILKCIVADLPGVGYAGVSLPLVVVDAVNTVSYACIMFAPIMFPDTSTVQVSRGIWSSCGLNFASTAACSLYSSNDFVQSSHVVPVSFHRIFFH